mmetsp:Transcript_26764/g.79486  ORF Transcript_26764/g.79486 Transcript_26764/m.79486 type:complete len:311 (-) Transcript_26764:105-1037(-)
MRPMVALAQHVVDVEPRQLRHHVAVALVALGARCAVPVDATATRRVQLVVARLRDEREPNSKAWNGVAVDSLIGAPVANSVANNVDLGRRAGGVGRDDLTGEVGHVDASVALASDVKVVVMEPAVPPEELPQERVCVRGRLPIARHVVVWVLGVRQTYACGAVQVDHVGSLVPGERVVHQLDRQVGCVARCALREGERAVLVGKAIHAGAARPAVEPQHDRVLSRVSLALRQVVEQLLAGADLHVPAKVRAAELAGEPRHAVDAVGLRATQLAVSDLATVIPVGRYYAMRRGTLRASAVRAARQRRRRRR